MPQGVARDSKMGATHQAQRLGKERFDPRFCVERGRRTYSHFLFEHSDRQAKHTRCATAAIGFHALPLRRIRRRELNVGCWMLDVGCWMLDVGCWMFFTLKTFASFVKFSHTVFALPFALASMVVAARDQRGWPGWRIFGLILAAMVCARTCAMAFNRIVDREFDKANPRTASRHLPSGQISLAGAWALCLLSGLGLVVASYFINSICFYLAPVAIFCVCFYSLAKRF